MSESLTERWLVALRSGKYRQGQHALRRDTEMGEFCHCCLGVLADLIDPTGWEDGETQSNVYGWRNGEFDDDLPSVILRNDIQSELIDKNDNGDATFLEIADYIEEHRITAHDPEDGA